MFLNNKYIRSIGLHVLIGILVFGLKFFSKVYFIILLIYFIIIIVNSSRKRRVVQILIACSYIVGCEVFLRMTGGNFLYEVAKYLVIVFVIIGMLFDGINSRAFPYFIFLLLLFPAVFVTGATATFDTNIRTAIMFNLSGPLCLAFVALYCYDKKIHFKDIQNILLAALLPIISTTVYLFLFTPNIRDVVTGTYSNFATSGGFGPNQVATALGLGMFIVASRYFLVSKTLIMKIINLFILGAISYRGLVTFSRGGIYTAVIIIIVFIVIYYISLRRKENQRIMGSLSFFIGIAILAWIFSSIQTGGLIDKRYANQDAAGREKEELATGRAKLISFELEEFISNPFFGVGAGKIKELRFEKEGRAAASHNEISRIMGEHGMMGIIAFLIIFIVPLLYRMNNRKNIFFYSFFLFWFLTVNHSSMRIAAPAFIYGLSLLNITYEKPVVYRKQIK
jgi:hypothetical protein